MSVMFHDEMARGMTEIELKLRLEEAAARRLSRRLSRLPGACERAKTRRLRAIYHDSPDGALHRAGIALRLRREGRRWVQTVKCRAGGRGALQEAEEHTVPAPGGRLVPGAIPDPALRERILGLAGDGGLSPQAVVTTRRRRVSLARAGDEAEIALDAVTIAAGGSEAAFHELEIEHVAGSTALIFTLAGELLPDGGLDFSTLSKAERARMLADEGRIAPPLAPRKAAKGLAPRPGMAAEQAARAVLRDCFAQIAANAEVIRKSDTPEGPHQLRIGLRRLRTALALFRPAIGGAEATRLAERARDLAAEVGRVRDLDVLIDEIVAPAAGVPALAEGAGALRADLAARAEAGRAALRAHLESAGVQALLLDLGAFIEARGWLDPADISQSVRLAEPVERLARARLAARWRKIEKRARNLADMDIEHRHDLRKELKKLRYGIEFLGPTLSEKRSRVLLSRLKRLQDVFGGLNDAAMAEALLTGAGAPCPDLPSARYAAGWIVGRAQSEAGHDWQRAQALWRDLAAAKRPW